MRADVDENSDVLRLHDRNCRVRVSDAIEYRNGVSRRQTAGTETRAAAAVLKEPVVVVAHLVGADRVECGLAVAARPSAGRHSLLYIPRTDQGR